MKEKVLTEQQIAGLEKIMGCSVEEYEPDEEDLIQFLDEWFGIEAVSAKYDYYVGDSDATVIYYDDEPEEEEEEDAPFPAFDEKYLNYIGLTMRDFL